jgi:hypothetical protein
VIQDIEELIQQKARISSGLVPHGEFDVFIHLEFVDIDDITGRFFVEFSREFHL